MTKIPDFFVRKFNPYVNLEEIFSSMDFPPSMGVNNNQSIRCAGWIYYDNLKTDVYDGNIYLENKRGKLYSSKVCIPRPDVSLHFDKLKKTYSGNYGFEITIPHSEYKVFIKGTVSKINLYEIGDFKDHVERKGKLLTIIGHSGAGKSTFLKTKGLDRWFYDMDVFLSNQNQTLNFDVLTAWTKLRRDHEFIIIPNEINFLKELKKRKKANHASISMLHFVYLKRSFEDYLDNIKKINSDGLLHKTGSRSELKSLYDSYAEIYESISDQTIDITSNSIDDKNGVVCTLSELIGL